MPLVEGDRASIQLQDPQRSFAMALSIEFGNRMFKQYRTNALPPVLRIDVDGPDVPPPCRWGLVAARPPAGKPDDLVAKKGDSSRCWIFRQIALPTLRSIRDREPG